MKIEDEIKVSRFVNNWQRASVNLLYTANWLNATLEKRASAFKITLPQFNVLRILRGQMPKASTNNLLKSRMISETSDISRLVNRLEKKGYVMRSKNEADKRATDIVITDSGLALLKNMEEDMLLLDILPQHIDEEQAALLSELLDVFRRGKE